MAVIDFGFWEMGILALLLILAGAVITAIVGAVVRVIRGR